MRRKMCGTARSAAKLELPGDTAYSGGYIGALPPSRSLPGSTVIMANLGNPIIFLSSAFGRDIIG